MAGPRVLVTDANLRSALAIVRSLGRQGIHVTCAGSTRFSTAGMSKYSDRTVVCPSAEVHPERFAYFIRKFLIHNNYDVLMPVGHESTRIVSERQDELSSLAKLPVPQHQLFERGLDKSKTLRAAKRAGVPHPRTAYPTSTEEAVEIVDSFEFPVVIKPREGAGSRGIRYVESQEQFETVYKTVHNNQPKPLIQERIPAHGQGMGAAFLYDRNGTIRAQFAYQRLREYPPGGGPSTLRESIEGNDILRYGQLLLDQLEWEGLAMVEFKRDPRDAKPKLMEINPRFWGSLHLPLFSGVDFPWLVLQHALGKNPDPVLEYEVGVRCRYMLPGDLLNLVARHNRQALREFFPLMDHQLHYDILSWDDPGPTFGRLMTTARYAFSPRMWRMVVFR